MSKFSSRRVKALSAGFRHNQHMFKKYNNLHLLPTLIGGKTQIADNTNIWLETLCCFNAIDPLFVNVGRKKNSDNEYKESKLLFFSLIKMSTPCLFVPVFNSKLLLDITRSRR